MKNLHYAASAVVGAILLAGCLAIYLVYPGVPASTASLHFDGFVVLPGPPGGGRLSVMDYLTVQGRSLFVASIKPGSVYRVPLGGGALPGAGDISVLAGKPSAHGVAFDAISGRGFISRGDADSVDVFDPASMRLLRKIRIGGDLDGILFDPITSLIYVGGGEDRRAILIDPVREAVTATIALGGEPEYAVIDPAAHLIYQNLVDTDEVVAVDLAKRGVVGRWKLPGCRAPTGMALDPAGPRLYIVCRGSAAMVVFDLGRHRVVASARIGWWPDSVAYDAALRVIYTTGISGELVILHPNGLATRFDRQTTWLHFGAHTLAVDPLTHRIYAAYASLLVPPRLAVFSVKAR